MPQDSHAKALPEMLRTPVPSSRTHAVMDRDSRIASPRPGAPDHRGVRSPCRSLHSPCRSFYDWPPSAVANLVVALHPASCWQVGRCLTLRLSRTTQCKSISFVTGTCRRLCHHSKIISSTCRCSDFNANHSHIDFMCSTGRLGLIVTGPGHAAPELINQHKKNVKAKTHIPLKHGRTVI